MTKIKKRELATSITTFTFLIISITGVLMFFHVLDQYTEALHKILGMAFVLFTAFHIFYNWKSMKNYFKKRTFIYVAVLTLVISSVFIVKSGDKGENPKNLVINSVISAPFYDAVSILGKDINTVSKKLVESGIIIANLSSIQEISEKNSISAFKVIKLISE